VRLAFIGFGLIGGSIARAVRDRTVRDRTVRNRTVRNRSVRDRTVGENPATPSWSVRAWSPSGEGPRRAAADGVIELAAADPEEALAGADLVVLAGPATACLAALDDLAGRWRTSLAPDAVITDVASTKSALLDRADAAGLRYVGGHPMAGLETSGYQAGRADLFVDRPWVVVQGRHAAEPDVQRVVALVTACQGRVVRMDAATHDRAVAGISHLPLVLAAALVEAVAGTADRPGEDWEAARGLAASGWRDMTRLARGDPEMGASIAATNALALAARLRDVRSVLDEWLAALERRGGPDEAELRVRLQAARARLEDPS
jgi:prephenate dehydrogenase